MAVGVAKDEAASKPYNELIEGAKLAVTAGQTTTGLTINDRF